MTLQTFVPKQILAVSMGGMNNQIGSISQEMEINNQKITVRSLTAILPENVLHQKIFPEK